jgi:hypothetical protein
MRIAVIGKAECAFPFTESLQSALKESIIAHIKAYGSQDIEVEVVRQDQLDALIYS